VPDEIRLLHSVWAAVTLAEAVHRAAPSIANMSFTLRRTRRVIPVIPNVKRPDKSGPQIFDRRPNPEHSEDKNGEVINRRRHHHSGTHRSHIHHHEIASNVYGSREMMIGK